MNLLRLLQSESRTPPRRLLWIATLCGLSNALILAVINLAASSTLTHAENFRALVLFVLVLALYIITQRHILITSTLEIERILDKIRVRIADKVRHAELLPLEKIGRATIYASVSKETLTISQAAAIIVIACQSAILVAFTLLYLAWLSRPAFLICIALTLVALSIHFTRARQLGQDLYEAMQRENRFVDALNDLLDGFKEVKMNRARSAEVFAEAQAISASVKEIKAKTQVQFSDHFIFSQISFYILIGAVVFLLPRISATSPAMLTKATAAILFIVGPIANVIGAIPTFARANAAVAQISELEAALDQLERSAGAPGAAPSTSPIAPPFRRIVFQDVVFQYPNGEGTPFRIGPIRLTIEAGKTLFIVGGNGTGKSTLLLLLTGLYRPTSGTIRVDGVEVGPGNYDSYRELFSVIFSDYHLFARLYGIPGVTAAEVEGLLELLRIEGKTRWAGGRFETLDLSTGQRKRLALLVTFLEDRPICVFDEWAADQDPVFRKFFYEELLSRMRQAGKTIVAATHDDRYFHVADQVLKMEDGKLMPFGDGTRPGTP
jgi:putative ATP-binding cassette transporter